MSEPYVPSAARWHTVAPEAAGFDRAKLADAVRFAQHGAATDWPVDLTQGLASGGGAGEPPPWNEILGPTTPRGAPNGLLLRGGRIVCEWGDTTRADMTFSIAKSYLAVLAGVARDRGLIGHVDEPLRDGALDAGFEHPQNRAITWRQLLQQTSEWQGSLWDKPDLIDRHRQVGGDNSKKGTHRDLQPPGRFWEYNDVRVNRLSLSLLQRFREPLPRVLDETIMTPIGASGDWRWHGYRNSYFEIDGRVLASVPGGSHWGGGLWIGSRDHARFGLLIQRRGLWGERRLIAADWIEQMTAPCPLNPGYGYLWWLNGDGRRFPDAPRSSFFAIGAGSSVIWIDPQLELVAVLRWVAQRRINDICRRFAASLTSAG